MGACGPGCENSVAGPRALTHRRATYGAKTLERRASSPPPRFATVQTMELRLLPFIGDTGALAQACATSKEDMPRWEIGKRTLTLASRLLWPRGSEPRWGWDGRPVRPQSLFRPSHRDKWKLVRVRVIVEGGGSLATRSPRTYTRL